MELRYKQFCATIHFSAETDSFYGEVLAIPELIAFQAKDLAEARILMREAVDRYLNYLETSSLVLSGMLE